MEAASTVKVNLEAKSSLESVSTWMVIACYSIKDNKQVLYEVNKVAIKLMEQQTQTASERWNN